MKTWTKRVIGSTVAVGVLAGIAVVGTAGVADATVPTVTANVYSWTGNTTYTVRAATPKFAPGTTVLDRTMTVEQNGKTVAVGDTVVLKPGTYKVTTVTTTSGSSTTDQLVPVALMGAKCQVLRTWSDKTMDISCVVPANLNSTSSDTSGSAVTSRTLFLTVDNINGLKTGASFVSPTAMNSEFVTVAFITSCDPMSGLPCFVRNHSQIVDQRMITVKYIKQTPHVITDAMRKRVTFGSSKAIADKEFKQTGSLVSNKAGWVTYKWKDFSINAKTGRWEIKSSTQITYFKGKAIGISRGMPA